MARGIPLFWLYNHICVPRDLLRRMVYNAAGLIALYNRGGLLSPISIPLYMLFQGYVLLRTSVVSKVESIAKVER